ncbi:MAG: TetR/AcrR family transcriptional regulator [Clostridiales bacterium]|nr:TetR/AcrR family transcriptional regulator [Clostridiales bacterium]
MNTQRENSRDKILEAAFRLLSKKGYANVSMRDIAAEAQVALGLLTYHFRTKENLFTALASKLVSTCFDDVVREMERGRSEEERMHLLSEYFKKILVERPDVMKIFLDFSIQAMWNRSFRFQVTYLFNKLAELIRDDVLSKKPSEDSPVLGKYGAEAVSKVILGSLYGTAFQVLLAGKSRKELEEIFGLGNTLIEICSK